jgi:tetratricopeptide (TPR) repeat protein
MRRNLPKFLALSLAAGLVCGCETPPEAQQIVLDAYAAYNTGQYDQAREEASRFMRKYPSRPEAGEALLIRGLSLFRQEQYLQSKIDMAAVLDRARRAELRSKAHFILAEIALRTGQEQQAIEHYRSCLEEVETGRPPAGQAHYRLGTLLLQKGRFEQADMQFSRLMYLFPDSDLTKRAQRLFNARAWTIHAGLFDAAGPAKQLVTQLAQAGLPARKQEQLAQDRLVHAVLVGRYRDMAAARQALPGVQEIAPAAYLTVDRRAP